MLWMGILVHPYTINTLCRWGRILGKMGYGVLLSLYDVVRSWLRLQTPIDCVPHPYWYWMYTKCLSTLRSPSTSSTLSPVVPLPSTSSMLSPVAPLPLTSLRRHHHCRCCLLSRHRHHRRCCRVSHCCHHCQGVAYRAVAIAIIVIVVARPAVAIDLVVVARHAVAIDVVVVAHRAVAIIANVVAHCAVRHCASHESSTLTRTPPPRHRRHAPSDKRWGRARGGRVLTRLGHGEGHFLVATE